MDISQPQIRNGFIDFLKGLCIICVILTHNLPVSVMKASVFIVWGAMAVPIFLLIQAYHVFNYDNNCRLIGKKPKSYKEHYNLSKLWRRIIKPFVLCTLFSGCLLIIIGHDPLKVLKAAIVAGGIGPGSYYVWIYLQFFLLLPLCLTFVNKWGGVKFLFLFIIISQGIEWLCMYIKIPDGIYRLTCFRYLFLIYLGYLWVSNKMAQTMTIGQIIMSLASLLILLILYYTTGSLRPFLHDTEWRSFHWICYFFPAFILPWILWRLYDKLSEKIKSFISEIGSCSYEIFLIQMIVFSLYPHLGISLNNHYVDLMIYFIITTIISIIPVLIWMRIKKRLSNRRVTI